MRVSIQVDGITLNCDTRDPETLARWLAEVFTSVEWNPSTMFRAQVYPGFVMRPGQGAPAVDWIADSRIITRYAEVKSAQEFVDMLQQQINDYEELKGG